MPGFFKNKKKVLVILVGALVLAMAGAGAVWIFYVKPANEAAQAAMDPPSLHKEPFQALWPLTGMEMPLSGRMGQRTLKLGFSFDLDSGALMEEMTLRREEIVESLSLALAGRSVEEMERSGSKVRLKYETLRLVNGLLEGGHVKGLYITEFLIL
jgi:flagellar basal body-associated protein FliL